MKRGSLLLVLGVLALLAAAGAEAKTLKVTTTADSGAGSLRAVIASAHAGDTVMLPASKQPYALTKGEIKVAVAPLTIAGAGATKSIIDASKSRGRVFEITARPGRSTTVTFSGVTVRGGRATTMPGGGGILVDYVLHTIALNLVLSGTVVSGNSVKVSTGPHGCCAGGGGIYNNGGDITLTRSSVTGNTANVTGTTSSGGPTACCDGGGGIYDNYGGPIKLVASTVAHNSATVAGPAYYCCHGGGGIYNDNYSSSSLPGPTIISAGSQLAGNSFKLTGAPTDVGGTFGNCCSGGGGLYQDNNGNVSILSSAVNGNTAALASGNCCHGGGGVYVDGLGTLIVTRSSEDRNTSTVNGPSSTTGTHALNHCCSGGGADGAFGAVELTNSTLDHNTSSVSSGGCCSGGGAIQIDTSFSLTAFGSTLSNNRSLLTGGTEVGGGAVFEDTGGSGARNTYTNTTISGNSTNAGPGQGGGGGLYVLNGSQIVPDLLANATVAGNSAPTGAGGGIFNDSGKLSSQNSIVALNTASSGANCAGFGSFVFSSLGYNLTDSPDTCAFTATGDQVVASSAVKLGPLASNGGPTLTRALLTGSPAIDGGNPAGCTNPAGSALKTDQRGRPRPSGPRCDIGAFEYQQGKPHP